MGLKSSMQQAATAAFKATADLQLEAYVKIRADSYNVATGLITNADVSHTVKVLFTRFTDEERLNNSDILLEDYRVLFPAKGLTFAPSPQDIVEKSNGDTYEIISVSLDSAEALYSLQTRAQ